MPDKCHALRSAVTAALLPAFVAGNMGSAGSAPTEQTLEAIRNCMAHSRDPWPEEWQKEYMETIRSAVELHRDAAHYPKRLEILRKGFAPYWKGLTRSKDRPLFEVYRCRMRWYVEHLMGTEFPSVEARHKLRDQYTEIWGYAADSLLTQFPFLDPNAVQAVRADDHFCELRYLAHIFPKNHCNEFAFLLSNNMMSEVPARGDGFAMDSFQLEQLL